MAEFDNISTKNQCILYSSKISEVILCNMIPSSSNCLYNLTKWGEIYSKSIKIKNMTQCITSLYLFNKVVKVLVRAVRKMVEIKEVQIGKEKVKSVTSIYMALSSI